MKKYACLLFALFISNLLFAQTSYKIISNESDGIVLDIQFGDIQQIPVNTPNGNEIKIGIKNGTPFLFRGYPDVPKISYPIIIPNATNSQLYIVDSKYTEHDNVAIAPSKGTLSRKIDPKTVSYEYGKPYQTNAFFPSEAAFINKPFVMRDFRGQTLMVSPVQYNAVTKKMRVYQSMRIIIEFSGIATENILTKENKPTHITEEYDGIYKNHFINYKTESTQYNPVADQGSLLIITPNKYLAEVDNLRTWKEMKGIKTYVVTTDTMGVVTDTKIKSVATEYFQNKQIAYLILVGDNEDITPVLPPNVKGPSDIAYAYINNGDHYPEFSVGRISGDNVTEVKTQIEKIISYEKSPNTTSGWMGTQIGIASNEGVGDENQYDYEHIHEIVDSNKNQYVYQNNIELFDDNPSGLIGNDQLGDPTASMLSDAINSGASLINYAGHGGSSGIVTTNFSSSDIASIDNPNKLPFFLVVGCSPGSFYGFECFGENVQRATNTAGTPVGTVSCFMSSVDQYWDEPMQAQDEFNGLLRGARPSNLKYKLGPMCADACMSMNDQYDVFSNPNGIFAGSDMTDTWIYFGDPTLSLYTKNEGTLSIDYDVHILQNSTNYQVNCPVNGATIGLFYQGNYLASSTVSGGKAYFNFPAVLNLDTVFITATKQNYSPAFGKAIVVNWALGADDIQANNDITIYPNPTSDELFLTLADNQNAKELTIIDALGNKVYSQTIKEKNTKLNIKPLSAGIYFAQVLHDGKKFVKQFTKK